MHIPNGSCTGRASEFDFFGRVTPEIERLCGACPGRFDCLTYGLYSYDGLNGIWGGFSSDELSSLRTFMGIPKPKANMDDYLASVDKKQEPLIVHGTMKGYRQEIKNKIPTCDKCRAENSRIQAARRDVKEEQCLTR